MKINDRKLILSNTSGLLTIAMFSLTLTAFYVYAFCSSFVFRSLQQNLYGGKRVVVAKNGQRYVL